MRIMTEMKKRRLKKLVLKSQIRLEKYQPMNKLICHLKRANKRTEAVGMKWLKTKRLTTMISILKLRKP